MDKVAAVNASDSCFWNPQLYTARPRTQW